jgi:hypothetical protein
MSNIYLTTLGESWAGGTTINSVDVATDGWIYLAGVTFNASNNSLVAMGYKNGELVWKSEFGNSDQWGMFNSVFYKDNYIYAAGAIGVGFDPAELNGETFPLDKPPLEERFVVSDSHNITAPVFVKINAETGELVLAKVIDSNVSGYDSLNSIQLDSFGNIYVSGGGWTPGPDTSQPYTGAVFSWSTWKFSSEGNLVWEKDQYGGPVFVNANDQIFTWVGNLIVELDANGNLLGQIDPGQHSSFGVLEYYGKNFIVDSNGDFFIALTRDDKANLGSVYSNNGVLTSVVVKVSGSTGEVVWVRNFDESGFSEPTSINFDANGNLLVSGYTAANMNGVEYFGQTDGYLVTVDPNSGYILNTLLIGTSARETINQAKFDANGNLLIAGAFGSKYYSIENTDYQNIYLIAEDGFTLMGNGLNNAIHGGDGNDVISSGLGDDNLVGGAGNDALNGGNGADTADYSSSVNGVNIDLSQGSATGIGSSGLLETGTDALSGIENVIGGAGNDVIAAGANGSTLSGGVGNDTYIIRNSNDTIIETGGQGTDAIEASVDIALTDSQSIEVITLTGTDSINATGNSANNTVSGNNASNVIETGSGNDVVYAGGGDDVIVGGHGEGDDTYDGGTGSHDRIKYLSALNGITINLATGQAHATAGNDAAAIGIDTLSNIEDVTAGNYDDIVIGTSEANSIDGSLGNDRIDGGAGNDTLDGGATINPIIS